LTNDRLSAFTLNLWSESQNVLDPVEFVEKPQSKVDSHMSSQTEVDDAEAVTDTVEMDAETVCNNRISVDTKTIDNSTESLVNETGKYKKPIDSDDVVKHGKKLECKMKKRIKSKSSGRENEDSTDANTVTNDKASAFSLTQIQRALSKVSFAEKLQSIVDNDKSSRTEVSDAEAATDTAGMGAETVLNIRYPTDTTTIDNTSDSLLNDTGKYKKPLDSDAVVKHGKKSEFKVKKFVKHKSGGHDNKYCTDTKTLTNDRASAVSLNLWSKSQNMLEPVAFVEKPQSKVDSHMSSQTEVDDAAAVTDTVEMDAETVCNNRFSVDTKIIDNSTESLVNETGKYKKPLDSDAVVKHGKKLEFKVKKFVKHESGGHDNKYCTDSITLTNDRLSAFTLNLWSESQNVLEPVAFVEKPQPKVDSHMSSQTEVHDAEAVTDTVEMDAETVRNNRLSVDTKTIDNSTESLVNETGKYKKPLDSDAVVKHGKKLDCKEKKRVKSKSGGHDNKDCTDTKTLTSDKASAFSLTQPHQIQSPSSDRCDQVSFPEKLRSKVDSDMSSRTEVCDAETDTDRVEMDAETMLNNRDSALSLNQLFECEKLSSDVSSVADKSQSEVNAHVSSIDGDSISTLTADKQTDLSCSLHELKKSSNKDSMFKQVKKHTKSQNDECSITTKNVTDLKVKTHVKGTDVCLSSEKCKKLSSGNSGTGLSGLKEQAIVKSVSSSHKKLGVRECRSAVATKGSKITSVTSSQPSEQTELLEKLRKELDSGLRSQGTQPPTLTLSHGQCQGSKRSEISENAATSLIPKQHKTHSGAPMKKKVVTIPHSDDQLHSKHKLDQISVLDPLHHQQNYGDVHAAGNSVSHHYRIPHKSRHTSSHREHRTKTATVHTSAPQAKKQDGNGAHDSSANFCSPHPETLHPEKDSGGSHSHQVDSSSVRSADEVQAEKPKNKVLLSLAEYKKRKRDSASTTAVTASVSRKVVQSADLLCMKSSLAEQLIISYARHSETSEDGGDGTSVSPLHSVDGKTFSSGDNMNVSNQMLAGNFSDGGSKYTPDYACSEAVPVPTMPLDYVESSSDHTVTATHDAQSENRGSFGDSYPFNLLGQSVLPAAQQKTETMLFSTDTSHTTCNTVDISLSSGTALNQMPDHDQNVEEMSKMVIVCRSDLSLANNLCEKSSRSCESLNAAAAGGGGDAGVVSSRLPLVSSTVNYDVNGNDKSQFVSVGNQDAAAETLLCGRHNDPDPMSSTSPLRTHLGSSSEEMIEHSKETEILSTNSAPKPIPLIFQEDVLEVQRQPIEQTNERHFSDVKHTTTENVDCLRMDKVDATHHSHIEDNNLDVLSSIFQVPPHSTTMENTELGIYI